MDLNSATVRVSSHDLPAPGRKEALCELIGRGFMNVSFDFQSDEDDYLTALWMLPGVVVTSGVAPPMEVRSHDLGREGDVICLAGGFGAKGILRSCGKEIGSGDGTSTLIRAGDAMCSETKGGWKPRLLRFDASLIRALVPDVDDRIMRTIPASTPALRMLDAYLPLICTREVLGDPQLAWAATQHLCDLVALAAGANGDGRELAEQRGLRAGRLSVLKRWTLERLSDPTLSIQTAAAALNVSTRYVQLLFHDEGTNFSEFVRAERLARAHRQLSSGFLAQVPISTIALNAGFSDISYFNRMFREAYGETPSDVKRRAEVLASD